MSEDIIQYLVLRRLRRPSLNCIQHPPARRHEWEYELPSEN